ncbi:MAG: DegT/DnrJ/EryC1/StrS family aminotransferase [Planctomycetes bacterium]|nr:DegT/DnrJ/EryC1/StrS family aminotransferase [Planctomycetota bacterium]
MNEPIPFIDLLEQYRQLAPEIDAAVAAVFASQQFILGQVVADFEADYAATFGLPTGSTVGVSSGTDALLVALMAAGVGPGDKVLTTPFSFFATAGTIARLGARPVFADIDRTSFNLSPAALAAHDPRDFKALIAVHLYGRVADMEAIRAWAGAEGPLLIEDAAQAVGSRAPDGRPAGLLGDFGCFSFFPTKNLGGAGDGGMVVAADPERAALLRKLRVHGAQRQYENEIVGGNFRLDAIQAAVLRVKLPRVLGFNAARVRNARRYDLALRGLPGLVLPELPADDGYNGHQYVIRSSDRDRLRRHLEDRGIGTAIYYPRPFHLLDCFRELGHRPGDFPEAEAAAREVLALPIFPELGGRRQDRIIEAIKDFQPLED